MALSTAMFSRHYKKARTDLSTSITFSGAAYTAVVGDESRGNDPVEAGFLGDDSIDCIILLSDFTTNPDRGDKITINGTDFRVQSYRDDPAGICRHLTLSEGD